MPSLMTFKGGLFFAMHQPEAMWIRFKSEERYLIKIYVGGVNAISGEPAVEDASTKLRRETKLTQQNQKHKQDERSVLQDYIVVPGQEWLDGIADCDGTVRQFVAMPFGSGYSAESQITVKETTGGIQFEVTPYRPRPKSLALPYRPSPELPPLGSNGRFGVWLKNLTGRKELFSDCLSTTSMGEFKRMVEDRENIPVDQQRLIYKGRQVEDNETMQTYNISHGEVFQLILRLRGGGKPEPQMTVAAGGKIKQTIVADKLGEDWLTESTTVFNVQILNSAVYKAITGEDPPEEPMSAETYNEYGMPFFKMYEEPSGIFEEFSQVNSIAEIDANTEGVVEPDTIMIRPSAAKAAPPGLVNPDGPLRPFRTVDDLRREYSSYHVAKF